MSNTLLSILIPTIPSRKGKFDKLANELSLQQIDLLKTEKLGIVEIIVDNSKPFLENGKSIGEKRQYLLDEANGKYVCFLDDDDNIAPNYLKTLVESCKYNPDCITFNAIVKNDYYWALISMSLHTFSNDEVTPLETAKRTVWHICPIRASIAKKVRFTSLNHNEDWMWLQQVIPLLKDEIHTDLFLTQYNHSEKGSEADKIVKSQLNFENKEENY